MYTRRNYSLKDMIKWTRQDVYKFIIIALAPVFLYSTIGLKWMHLPWLPIALVGTAVAFLVSFKNNASYARLWEARKIWGGLVNVSRSFGILVNDFITSEEAKNITEEELRTIKKTMVNRHIAWMTAHRYFLRQTRPWEIFMKRNTNKEYADFYEVKEWVQPFEEAIKPYLSEKEFQKIKQSKSQASQIIALQSKHLKQLKNQGLIWEFSYLEMEQLLIEMVTLQGKNERIKNFPYPRQFATLNLFFVWIFILLLPLGIMSEFDKIGIKLLENSTSIGSGFLDSLYNSIAKHFIWLSVPFSVVISWIFHTMERIGEVSENPFEGTANDVPITTMARGIEIDMLEIIGENELPESIPTRNHIQM